MDTIEHARTAEIMELRTDTYASRVINKLPMPGKLLQIDPSHLIVAERCVTAGDYIRKIEIETGKVVDELHVGENPFDLIDLQNDLFAVAVMDESKVVFVRKSTIEVEKVLPLSCQWPEVLRLYKQ